MKTKDWMAIGLVACSLAGPGCKKGAPREAPAGEAERAQGAGAPATVTMSPEALGAAGVVTAPAERSTLISYDEMPGTIEAPSGALVVVNTPAAGVVQALAVDVGDRVKAGQQLATVKSAELAKAQGEYRRSVAAEEHAAAAFKRSEALGADGLLSSRRLESDRLQWRASQAELEEATERIRILGGSLNESTGSIAIASPIAGTIATRTANRGEAVAENAPLFTVVDVTQVVAQLRAPGGTPVRPGAEVSFTAEALPDQTFAATVKSSSDVIDPETRRFFIRCSVANAGGTLKPGMFISAKVPRPEVTALVVPESAILDMEGGHFVFVASAGGTFERRPVTLGPRSDGKVVVRDGLEEHEAIVTKGAFWVRSRLQRSELEE